MQAWTPVKVIDETLESHGQAGVCQGTPCANTKKGGADLVDVKMDTTGEVVTFEVQQLQPLA